RTLRALLGHGLREDRDAVFERPLCTLRRVRRLAVSTARAQSSIARQIDPRCAGTDCQRSDSVFHADRRTENAFQAARCTRGSRAWLFATGAAAEHAEWR